MRSIRVEAIDNHSAEGACSAAAQTSPTRGRGEREIRVSVKVACLTSEAIAYQLRPKLTHICNFAISGPHHTGDSVFSLLAYGYQSEIFPDNADSRFVGSSVLICVEYVILAGCQAFEASCQSVDTVDTAKLVQDRADDTLSAHSL